MTTDIQGPLWYGGFVETDNTASEAHLQAVLAFHGVRRIAIGQYRNPDGDSGRQLAW